MLTLLSLLSLFVQPHGLDAESGVFVQATQNGQGLLRGRGSECFAITPHHVVDGAPATVRVIGSRATQVDAVFSRQLPRDLAILRIEAPGQLPCRDWSRVEDLPGLLRKHSAGTLSVREANGSQTLVPVVFRGLDDEAVYVRPSQPGDQISQSMSGATLLVDGVPVGMLLSVTGGEGFVYQLDDIFRVSEGFFSPTASAQDVGLAGEYNFGGTIVKVQPSPAGFQYIQAGSPVHTLVFDGARTFTSTTMPGARGEFRLDEAGNVEMLAMRVGTVVGLGPRIGGPAPDTNTLASLAGTYDLTPTVHVTVSLRSGRLTYRVSNELTDFVLIPTQGLHFTFQNLGVVSVKFQRGPGGAISHFVLFAGDTTVVATRRK